MPTDMYSQIVETKPNTIHRNVMKNITYPLFLVVLSGLALPKPAKAMCFDGSSCQTSAGTLQILEYQTYEEVFPFDPPTGKAVLVQAEGVSIEMTFNPSQDGNYRYISAIISADAPTIFFDGTTIEKPLVDPPPGGYINMPAGLVDLSPYYDTPLDLPHLLADKPGGSLEDIKSIGGNAEAIFETWLVEVVDEVFGDDPTKARDDIFTIDPLAGWTWGYDIQRTDNGNANPFELDDFLTKTQPFSWLNEAPTEDWMSALNRVYGTGETEDRFNVAIAPIASIIEPSSVIGLIGLGILGVGSIRKRKS